jgi:CubicO group peptidase (beta-lactamase class C family)
VTRRRLLKVAVIVVLLPVLAAGTWLVTAGILYSPEYVVRVITLGESDVGDYLDNLPHRPLTASSAPSRFETVPEEAGVAEVVESAFGADDLDAFLTETETQSLVVIKDDTIVLERYANGWQRDSMVTSFSVAKSFVSTLVGIAIEAGAIGGLDDPITIYLPELAERDARFGQVTIRHLLMMSSGLAYEEDGWFVFNGDDPLTTYHPDQRRLALTSTRIAGPPGETFSYNKYHPQLLGLILERTTGMSVTEWTQARLWDPLGMEFDGAWTLDSEAAGFEKMEAGLNARAIDFAKLGRLFLHEGEWDGTRIVSPAWVATATGVDPADRAQGVYGGRTYGLMWWGVARPSGPPDFYAAGDHGQYIYVSPQHRVVIVRTGVEYGVSSSRWVGAFTRIAEGL